MGLVLAHSIENLVRGQNRAFARLQSMRAGPRWTEQRVVSGLEVGARAEGCVCEQPIT